MGVSLQAVTLQVRGGAGHEKYGDPYTVCGTVQIIGKSAHVSGLCGSFTRADFAEFKALLRGYGVTDFYYERLKRDAKNVTVNLTKGLCDG